MQLPSLHSLSRSTASLLASLALLAFSALLSASLLAQAPAPAELPQDAFTIALDQPLPTDTSVIVGKLDNGIRYYIRENAEPAQRAELRLVVDAGSVLEDDTQIGLAHFLEHMAFNGTEHFAKQELIGFMESIGMRLGPGVNASTSFDETIYKLQLPTDNPEHMATAFQIMEDWATGLTLDAGEIELERGVVIEEWRLGQGAQTRIRDQQMPVLLKDSRYAQRLPIGTLENLQGFDPDALRSFYRDWYRPELMGVVAVGDFDAAAIEQLLRAHFASIPASANPKARTRFTIPEHATTEFTIATDPEVPVTQVAVYHKQPANNDWSVGGYRQRLVEQLYNVLLSTRFQELARQANPPFLGASSGTTGLVRPISAYVLAAVVPENGVQRGLETLLTEAERVAQFGFTAAELERQQTALLRASEQQYNNRASRSSESHAAELIRAHLNGEAVPGAAWEYALLTRFLPTITLDEVNQVGKQWNNSSNRVVAVTVPEKAGVAVPTAAELSALIAASSQAAVTAYQDTNLEGDLLPSVPRGSRVTATRILEGGLTEWTLGNGIKVVLKPTAFKADEILFSGFRAGGTSLASDTDFIPANTAVTVIANGGLAAFNAIDLQKKLSGKVANVVPYISDYEEGLRGSGSPADLETLLQLIYLRMTAPRADETFFTVFKTQSTAALQNRSANPAIQFEDTFLRLMYQNHPRRQPPTVEMLAQTDLAKSMAFYQQRLGDASGFTFVFVGSIDPTLLQPLVETYLGGLPTSGRQHAWKDAGIRNPTGRVEETVKRGLEPQSSTRIAFNGAFDIRDNAERMRLVSVGQLLQTRLRNVMREKLGGTYNVQVRPQMNWIPVDSCNLIIDFGSDPQRAGELTAIVFAEIEALKQQGPTAAELEDVRQSFQRAFETSVEQNAFWLSQLVQAYSLGLESPAQDILAQPAVLQALTREAVHATAKELLNAENYVRVTLLPENQ